MRKIAIAGSKIYRKNLIRKPEKPMAMRPMGPSARRGA